LLWEEEEKNGFQNANYAAFMPNLNARLLFRNKVPVSMRQKKTKLTWEGGQKFRLLAELNWFGSDGRRSAGEQLERRAQADQPRSWTTAAAAAAAGGGHSSRQLKHRCLDRDIVLFGTDTKPLLQKVHIKKVTVNTLRGIVS
jgi:hypothetical protein